MAFIFMSVSECILNIRMLAQDDLNSFLKNARKTFKFLEKNDTFIIVIESLRCKFNDQNRLLKIHISILSYLLILIQAKICF